MQWPRLSIVVLILSLPHALTACDSVKVLSMDRTSTLLKGSIRVGSSRQDVIDRLGEPHGRERHGATEFLFYQTVWQVADRAAMQSPIAILGDKVVGLGKVDYDRIVLAGRQGWGITLDP